MIRVEEERIIDFNPRDTCVWRGNEDTDSATMLVLCAQTASWGTCPGTCPEGCSVRAGGESPSKLEVLEDAPVPGYLPLGLPLTGWKVKSLWVPWGVWE